MWQKFSIICNKKCLQSFLVILIFHGEVVPSRCIIWGLEIIKITEKIYCLADSYIKVAKNFHNYLKYKVFLIMLIFDGVLYTTILRTRNLEAIWNAVLGKVRLSIVWNIDDYQKKCSFSIFDIFGGVQQRDW